MINVPSSPNTNVAKKLFGLNNGPVNHATSPITFNTFKLGSISYQSSPFQQKLLLSSFNLNNNNNDEDDDDDKPKVFQCEDHIPPPHQTPQIESPLSKTLNQTSSSKLVNYNDNLNISSPNAAAANESFISNHTKSSLKTSFSALTNNSSNTSSKEVKHVKFRADYMSVETPVMFSRCSSMTSLNSFDIKSVHSSVASEYSRRPSGIMSPSEIPDSPDDISYIQQQQQRLRSSTSLHNQTVSKSNEITMIERTLLNNNGSEKNSFYAPSECGSNRLIMLKDNTISYDCEGGNSPWRSEISSLSALTFDDNDNDNKNSQDVMAILSLLQTTKKQANIRNDDNIQTAPFTPPVKLPATKSLLLDHNFTIGQNTQFFNIPPPAPSSMSTTSSIELYADQIKSYAVENTPSQLSPSASEFSIPSLMKADIQKESIEPPLSLLFSRLNLTTSKSSQSNLINTNNQQFNNNNNNHDDDDDDYMPKVYKEEEDDVVVVAVSNSTNNKCENINIDSPKVFVTEGTPMCYSRYSSTSSLNQEQIKNDTINKDDVNNKSSNNLLSDSCHKPTNTPAGFGNMSRESYSSSESDNDEDDEKKSKEKLGDKCEETNQDEVLLENFIKKMLPGPSRKSISKLPVSKKSSVEEKTLQKDDKKDLITKEELKITEKPKKRLSEDKKPPTKQNSIVKISNLKKSITQTASTYSLQTITSSTTCCTSTSSTTTTTTTTNSTNHHHIPHYPAPIVAMTKTAQLRLASKVADSKHNQQQTTKASLSSLKNATNTHLNRTSSTKAPLTNKPLTLKNDLLNNSSLIQQNEAIQRRKSIHSLTPLNKKSTTLSRVNENIPKQIKVDSKLNSNNNVNKLKQSTNLNSINKATSTKVSTK